MLQRLSNEMGAIDKRCVRCVRYARFVAEAEALQDDGRILGSRLHESCSINSGMKIGRRVAARAGEWSKRQDKARRQAAASPDDLSRKRARRSATLQRPPRSIRIKSTRMQ